MVLFNHSHRSFRVFATALTFLFSLSLPLASYANTSVLPFPTVVNTSSKVGSTWKNVRVHLGKTPKGSASGFFVASAAILTGDKLVEKYEQGQFTLLANDLQNAVAWLHENGKEASGWVGEQLNNLKEKFDCNNGVCTEKTTPSSWGRNWESLTFKIQNRSETSNNLNKLISQRDAAVVQANSTGWKDYAQGGQLKEVCILGSCGPDTLDNFASSNLQAATISVKFTRFCATGSNYNGCTGAAETIVGYTVNVSKPEQASEADRKPAAPSVVGQKEMAESVPSEMTEQQAAEVVGTCVSYGGCGSVARPTTSSSVPSAIHTPVGVNPAGVSYPPLPEVSTGVNAGTQAGEQDYIQNQSSSEEGVSTAPSSMTDFCHWASAVCEFIDWVKQEPPSTEHEPVPVSELQPEYDDVQIRFQAQCPQPLVFQIGSFGSQSVSYQPLCDLATQLQPFVIFLGYFSAIFIVAGISRGGGTE